MTLLKFKLADYQRMIADSIVQGKVPDIGNRNVRRRKDDIVTA